MLIKPEKLKQAITQFDIRTDIINELCHASLDDKYYFEKKFLAWMLGAAVYRSSLDLNTVQYHIADMLSMCINRFDQVISIINQPEKKKEIVENYYRLLQQFNENPNECMKNLLGYWGQWVVASAQSRLKQLAKEMHCASKISESEWSSIKSALWRMRFNEAVGHAITFTHRLAYLDSDENTSYDEFNNYIRHSIILQSRDGTIVQAIHLKHRGKSTKHVVLALVGHFPFEQKYLVGYYKAYLKLFGEVVFINHRNYAQRSARFAESMQDLSDDVIAFVNYFKRKNKRITLYGMCGGAPIMLHAAKRLNDDNQPVKLILDRFVDGYAKVIDRKTMERRNQCFYSNQQFSWIGSYKQNLTYHLRDILGIGLKLFLYNTAFDFDFANMVRQLPVENVLLLQAKGFKLDPEKAPIKADYFVHPENDLRNAYKEIRHHNKKVLLRLTTLSILIAVCKRDSSFEKLFIEFYEGFHELINEISDEKILAFGNAPDDLHSLQLPLLSTRGPVPLSRYLQSFMKSASTHVESIIERLPSGENLTESDNGEFKNLLGEWLYLLKENQHMIAVLAGRAQHSKRFDLVKVIKQLETDPFFNECVKQNNLQLV